MATNITTTYVGESRGSIITSAILGGNTLKGEYISILDGIKYKEVIKKMTATGLIANATCNFTDAGTLTLTEAYLYPKEFQINKQECIKDFYPNWSAGMRTGRWNSEIPFQDVIAQFYADLISNAIETEIWAGTGAVVTGLSGLTVLAANDANVIDVTATTLSKSNIIAELEKVVNAIPEAIKFDMDTYIAMSPTAFMYYLQAMNALGNATNGGALTESLAYGIKLFVANGMPTNKMMAYNKRNVFFGTDLVSDHSEVKVIDMRDTDGSQNVRFVLRATADVNFAWGAEIVLYA